MRVSFEQLDNFIKKRRKEAEQQQSMTPDEVEQVEIEKQMQRQLDEDALQAERVVHKW